MPATGRPPDLADPWPGRSSENALNAYAPCVLVADQIVGINGLVNLSNIVFLVAFSVRDVLRLRLLSIVGEAMILPYYYFQSATLWPPIFWGVAFMMVNAVRVVAIVLERRPVVLSDQEERLYGVAFRSISKREFLGLVGLACRWVEYSPGEIVVRRASRYPTQSSSCPEGWKRSSAAAPKCRFGPVS